MTFVVGCSRFVVWSRKPGGQRLNDVVIVGLCTSPNRSAQAWGPAVPSGVIQGLNSHTDPHMFRVSCIKRGKATQQWFSRYCPATEGTTNTLTRCDKWCELTIVVSQGWLAKWSNNCVESLGPHVGIASAGWRCRCKSKRAMASFSKMFTHCRLIGVFVLPRMPLTAS